MEHTTTDDIVLFKICTFIPFYDDGFSFINSITRFATSALLLITHYVPHNKTSVWWHAFFVVHINRFYMAKVYSYIIDKHSNASMSGNKRKYRWNPKNSKNRSCNRFAFLISRSKALNLRKKKIIREILNFYDGRQYLRNIFKSQKCNQHFYIKAPLIVFSQKWFLSGHFLLLTCNHAKEHVFSMQYTCTAKYMFNCSLKLTHLLSKH